MSKRRGRTALQAAITAVSSLVAVLLFLLYACATFVVQAFYCDMTKIIFRSALHYDATLTGLAGGQLSSTADQELDKFVSEIQEKWKLYNDTLFNYYKSIGLTLPSIWYVYPVHPNGKITSFGEPTTILIRENKEEVIATLVHELCHVFCSFDQNDSVISPIWNKISRYFKELDEVDRAHILIIALARAGLYSIFGTEKSEELLSLEKEYVGLKGAWGVIDENSDIAAESPLAFLEELVRSKQNN